MRSVANLKKQKHFPVRVFDDGPDDDEIKHKRTFSQETTFTLCVSRTVSRIIRSGTHGKCKKKQKKKKEKLPNRFLLLSSKLDIQSSASGYGCPATTLLRLDGVNFWSRRLLPFPPPPLRLVTLFHFPRFVLSVRVFSKSIRRSSHAHTQKIGKETSGTGSR